MVLCVKLMFLYYVNSVLMIKNRNCPSENIDFGRSFTVTMGILEVKDCSFYRQNTNQVYGGVIHASGNSSLFVESCMFQHCSSQYSGGCIFYDGNAEGIVSLKKTCAYDCYVELYSCAFAYLHTQSNRTINFDLVSCVACEKTPTDSSLSIWFNGGNHSVVYLNSSNNFANTYSSLSCCQSGTSYVRNSNFVNNTAIKDCIIFFSNENEEIGHLMINSNIINNYVGGEKAAVTFLYKATIEFRYCIFINNYAHVLFSIGKESELDFNYGVYNHSGLIADGNFLCKDLSHGITATHQIAHFRTHLCPADIAYIDTPDPTIPPIPLRTEDQTKVIVRGGNLPVIILLSCIVLIGITGLFIFFKKNRAEGFHSFSESI